MISSINKEKFEDYDGFVEKFRGKKTTDDCYTPCEIYEVVKEFAINEYNLQDYEIIRPFYPDKEYRNLNYLQNQVVIDNPPFSILAKIIDFYLERNIKFFLFAPRLTCFDLGKRKGLSFIIVGQVITYENGAEIPTCFITNMDKYKIRTSVKLDNKLREIQKQKAKTLPKYEYPHNLLTVSSLCKFMKRTKEDICIKDSEVHFVRRLDAQKEYKKTIFGAGFLLSDKKALHINTVATKEDIEEDILEFALSEREKEIIKTLNNE